MGVVSREPVPEDPPLPPAVFRTDLEWMEMIGAYRLFAATHAGAMEMQRLGPKGGRRFAVTTAEAWRAWAVPFNEGVEKRNALRVARILSGKPAKEYHRGRATHVDEGSRKALCGKTGLKVMLVPLKSPLQPVSPYAYYCQRCIALAAKRGFK